MGKGGHGKSSASAGTRKKHAKKHAPPPEEPMPKTKKGKKERAKKELRQKIYIPPVKPAPIQPDPLETTGLAHTLPPDLLIVLRSFTKKAEVTKIRALEELQVSWVERGLKGDEEEGLKCTLVEMLPVWLHHVSPLFLHPSRRVRALAASIHFTLLQIPPVREQIFFFLRETASTSQAEIFLGSWCIAAYDVDKAVAATALRSWNEAVALVEFVQRTALDPAGIYGYLNPVQPSTLPSLPQSRKSSGKSTPILQLRKDNPEQLLRTKLEETDVENEQDRNARLRSGALGAIKWILESFEEIPGDVLALFSNPAFLTSLNPKQIVSWVDLEPFGYAQPAVRKNMWALLLTVLSTKKRFLEPAATQLSRAVLRSAFIETDSNVQFSMWHPLLLFLKEFPDSWELEAIACRDEDEEDEDKEDGEEEEEEKAALNVISLTSAAYQEFLQFLQLGCSGSPANGYPTVVVIMSTIPFTVISSYSSTALQDLFYSFWAALEGRALSSLNRTASSAAFLSSVLECMVLVLKRVFTSSAPSQLLAELMSSGEDQLDVQGFSKAFVDEQFSKMWQEAMGEGLKMIESDLAKIIVKTMRGLGEVDPALSEAAWATLSSSIFSSSLTHPKLLSRLIKELQREAWSLPEWSVKVESVIAQLSAGSLDGLASRLAFPSPCRESAEELKQEQQLLSDLLEAFEHELFSVSPSFKERLDELISGHAYTLLKVSASIFLAVLVHRGPSPSSSPQSASHKGVEVSVKAWNSALSQLALDEGNGEERERLLRVLVDAAQAGRLPVYLEIYGCKSESGPLDDLVRMTVADGTSCRGGGIGGWMQLLRGVLIHHQYFISLPTFFEVFEALCASLKGEITEAFRDPFFSDLNQGIPGIKIPWTFLESLFSLVLSTFRVVIETGATPGVKEYALLDGLASDSFLYSYLLPLCGGIEAEVGRESFKLAGELWKEWYEDALEMGNARAGLREVREKLTMLIVGTRTRVSPQTVVNLLFNTSESDGTSFFEVHPEFRTDTIVEFMPDISDLDRMLADLMPNLDTTASMGVLDALVPPSSGYPYSTSLKLSSSGTHPGELEYDRYGYSAYARGVTTLATVFARDRASAKSRDGVEMLKHFGVVEVCAWDGICVPGTLGNGKLFGEKVLLDPTGDGEDEMPSMPGLITKIEQVMTYILLLGGGHEPWRRYVLDSLALPAAKPVAPLSKDQSVATLAGVGYLGTAVPLGGVNKTAHATMNPLSNFVLDMIGQAVQNEMDLKSSILGIGKSEARALKNDVVLMSRTLRRVLEKMFDDADSATGSEEVEKWVGFVRRIEQTAPSTSSTILSAIASLGLDSPRLERLRNEYAAALLGVPTSKANTQGLELLRALGSCVPPEDVDDGLGEFETRVTTRTTIGAGVLAMKGRPVRRGGSDVIILPVQRAVNLVRACHRWVEGQEKAEESGENKSDEDEDEEGPSEDVEGAMLAVFIGLLPILQNAPGKHWDFMWDVVETVLENSMLEDEAALLGLSRALRFVRVMEDLMRTNKPLKGKWSERRVAVLGSVRDLLLEDGSESKSNSLPRSVCRELVLSIVQSLPGELIDQHSLGKMCHLVVDSSMEVQKMGYGMLKKASEKRTEWIVIEVGMGSMGNVEEESDAPETDETVPPNSAPAPVEALPVEEKKVGRRKDGRRRKKRKQEDRDEGPSLLPRELIEIIESDEENNLFGWMLGWMLVFDLFNDVSLKVKSMYIEQLRNLDLVGLRLIPVVIHLLRLDEGFNKAIKVDTWAIDEFYVSYYEPVSAPVLAAHLYYRALLNVPSLIHAWVLGCKDRQLSHAITTLTSQHFSPLIIQAELTHLKSAEGLAELAGEGLTVKIIGGNSEIVAGYVVDDHQLEIRLKIPPDWPLHRIEVRDEKRVGVDENRWRAWVLAVQQTIWTHNGRIVDGLSLFKKNVTLHFEGQVECAICYSIISVSDGTLPKKPCKTCRNRFHAGCLYKWFNTSHSSSCPLCRSNII